MLTGTNNTKNSQQATLPQEASSAGTRVGQPILQAKQNWPLRGLPDLPRRLTPRGCRCASSRRPPPPPTTPRPRRRRRVPAHRAARAADELAEAQIPIIVHPTMYRATGETEHLSFETAATLHDARIPIALQSGFEPYVPRTRVVLFEAGMAAAHGLPFDAALATITIGAATILGIDDRVGSLEIGKAGDIALFDGDPFEYTTHCIGVIIDGIVMSEEVR